MSYPLTAGSKTGSTSQAAADSVDAASGQVMVLSYLRAHGPLTADEVADGLGRSVLFVRPRASELRRLGLIQATGQRRKNRSGQSATVWMVCQVKEPAQGDLVGLTS